MSQRDRIRMTEQEVEALLEEERTITVASIEEDGRPHLVAMWYVVAEGTVTFWTYGSSHKMRNLRRDPRLSVLVEAGEAYQELRGAQLQGRAVIVEDDEEVARIGLALAERYTGPVDERAAEGIRAQAAKRVAVAVQVDHVASWDHRKL